MSNSITIKQHKILIDNCVGNRYPNKETLRSKIDIEDKGISVKTLERRIKELRDETGIEIIYSRKRKGYYIVEETLNENKNYYKRINHYFLNDVLSNNRKLNFIELDDEEMYSGLVNIKTLVYAISSKSEVTFLYEKEGDTPKKVIARPWFIKEFEKMWYVIVDIVNEDNNLNQVGNKSHKFHRTYALDRITMPEETGNSFSMEKDFDPKSILKHLIGVNYNTSEKPVKIILEMSTSKAHLLRNLPIHHSQRDFKVDENTVRFELFVKTNQELKNRIIRFIDIIKVIEPESLKTDFKIILKKGLENIE